MGELPVGRDLTASRLSGPLWVALALSALGAGGCRTGAPGFEVPDERRFHLGSHHRPITTASAEAQRAFDHGLTLAYAFSHDAAEEEFRRAAAADPECAMAWWGVALVNGPHINLPAVSLDRAKAAWDALGRARALAAGASPVERRLIEALSRRHADPQPGDRTPLDRAYAEALGEVYRAHPGDADVACLFAESLMDLRPWDLWTSGGKPRPGTLEIRAALARALEIDPLHPGANHFWVHLVEASPRPEDGVVQAVRLGSLVPGAGHLVHMPSHIWVRLGRWEDAAEANRRAIEADAWFRSRNPRPGFYATYMAHNRQFLGFVGMMTGRSAEALRAARAMEAEIPDDLLRRFLPPLDGIRAVVPEILVRFGRWEAVLAEPAPAEDLPLATALWRFTRSVSLAALGRMEDAEAERTKFRAAAARVPAGWRFLNNSAADLLAVASRVVDGEMAARGGDLEAAVAALREGVRLEDALRYNEPPDWLQPVRHSLGAVLLRAGRAAEAETIYREDLARFPGNGWSLLGLERALRALGRSAEAAEAATGFRAAWAGADVDIESSCLCLTGESP